MEELEKKIPIWPCIKEPHLHYSKLDTENDLDYIAEKLTHTKRPLRTLNIPQKGNFVAKRYGCDSDSPKETSGFDFIQDLLQ